MDDTDSHPAISPAGDKAWEELVKNVLRAEMMRRGVSYAALAERLAVFGITDNELNLRNKVSRGRFTAVFLMQCLKALEVEWVHVPASIEAAAQKGGAQALAQGKAQP
jgi:hypothetical protein